MAVDDESVLTYCCSDVQYILWWFQQNYLEWQPYFFVIVQSY